MGYSKQFKRPGYYEHVIEEEDKSKDGKTKIKRAKKIGTLRIKPNGVLWKPASSQKFYKVTLGEFTEWITDSKTGAKITES